MRNAKFILFFIPLIVFISCSPQNSKIIVAEYGNNKVYMDDFEKAYAKNSGGFVKTKTDSLESLQKFLDLFVTYKMKLRNAEVRGYTTDADMQKELRDYKINIGSTLFLEEELYEPNIRKLYERRKTEFRASHIFLIPDSTMNEEKIVELGNQLIQRIQKGEDFAALAKQYSKDTYTKNKGGDVYYFTAGQINSPQIEDAVYNTEPGKIYPRLVNSGFGYHIIKLTDKKTRRPSIRAEHILIRFSDSTGTDTAKALRQIQEIEQKIKNGADFGEMAFKYSQDKGSAVQRGDLGFFGRSRMVKEFDEAAFNLKKGEVSPIVKTQFGFHLIRLVDESSYPTYQEEKDELKEIYRRVRYKLDFEKLVEKLKAEFNYLLNRETFNIVLSKSDTVKVGPGYWTGKLKKEIGEKEIFKINNKSFSVDSLFSFLIKKGLFFNRTLDSKILNDGVNQYAGDLLVREKALVYDKVNPEFAKLMEEYESGIYLFKILDEEVWSKLLIDSAKVKSFYEQTKQNYKWKERVEFKEIYNQKDSLINSCYALAVSGYNYDTLVVRFNQRTGYENKPGYYGLVDTDFNELAKRANALKNIGDVSKPFQFDDGWSIVKLVKREPARLKTFDEAKAEIVSILQDKESKRLEDEYINKLKSIYRPKVYYDELVKALKK